MFLINFFWQKQLVKHFNFNKILYIFFSLNRTHCDSSITDILNGKQLRFHLFNSRFCFFVKRFHCWRIFDFLRRLKKENIQKRRRKFSKKKFIKYSLTIEYNNCCLTYWCLNGFKFTEKLWSIIVITIILFCCFVVWKGSVVPLVGILIWGLLWVEHANIVRLKFNNRIQLM